MIKSNEFIHYRGSLSHFFSWFYHILASKKRTEDWETYNPEEFKVYNRVPTTRYIICIDFLCIKYYMFRNTL